jgi:GNAT superfamily N-acetyltransferase
MKQIDSRAALEILRKDQYLYLIEILSLDRDNPVVPKKVFGNSDLPTAILLVEEFPHGVCASIPVFDEGFAGDCLRWLAASYRQFSLCSANRRVFDALEGMRELKHGSVGCRRSFVCTSLDRVPGATPDVRRLTREDLPLAEGYPEEGGGQPGLRQFLPWSLDRGDGEVYAATEGKEIVGYLYCRNAYRNIWDVGHIHVRAERRRQGIAVHLAAAYARAKLNSRQVPYYSGASGEASERTALRAGFALCREVYYSEVSSRRAAQAP